MLKTGFTLRVRLIRYLPAALLLLGLCSCEPKPNTEQLPVKGISISVEDFDGNTVHLKSPAKRIIALAPHIVENVFTAGAGDKLVGVVSYSDYPDQAKSLPIVGGYEKANLEAIFELKPDLVIAWKSGNSNSSLERLKELGFTVYVDQPDNLLDVAKSIQDIGTLAGTPQVANTAVRNYLNDLARYETRYANEGKITSFYQVWKQPLHTINGNHIISDAINICGGINIYADETAVSPVVNIESVLERNPLAIIASGMSAARPEWLDDWKQWPSLNAVKNDNLFFVNPNHIQRHTVRLLLGLESICKQLDQARAKQASTDISVN